MNDDFREDLNEDLPLFATDFMVVGRSDDSFIESYVAEQEDSESDLGDFFVVVELVGLQDEGDDIGESLTQTFRKAFYSADDLDAYSRFEEALKAVNQVAIELQEQQGVNLNRMNVAIGALVEDVLYLTRSNDAEIYLVRKGQLSSISENIANKRNDESDLFSDIMTGNLEKGDVVLFTTSRLLRYITAAEIGKMFHNKEVREGFEFLEDALRMEVLGRVGVLAIKVNEFLIPVDEDDNDYESIRSNGKGDLVFRVKHCSHVLLKFAKKWGRVILEYFTKFASFVATFFAGRKIKLERKGDKGTIFIAVAVLLGVVLIAYVVFSKGLLSGTVKDLKENLLQADEIVNSAKSEPDKSKATQLLISAEEKANEALEHRSLKTAAREVLNKINEVRSILDNVQVVSNPDVFADISSKRSDTSLLGLVKAGSSMYAYDNNRMYEFLTGLIKDPVDVLDQGKLVSLTYVEDNEVVAFMTDGGKMREYDGGVIKYVDSEDGVFKVGTSMTAYGSRVYVLDSEANQIWKYDHKRDSYSKVEPYLKVPTDGQLAGATSIAIDGAVYVLFEDGKIERYYTGELDADFEIKDKPLYAVENPTQIYTHVDVPYVFVMEPIGKRIIQYYKDPGGDDLIYSTQYYFETLGDIRGFLVDYENRKLYVADSQKVYVTNLSAS